MESMDDMMSELHFLRPLWLLAILPTGLLWWRLRCCSDASRPWHGVVAPHLLTHLLIGDIQKTRFGPLEIAGVAWFVSIIAIAGPTWQREPTPFADDTDALAIVVKVTPSMMIEDVQPNRLERTVQKIHDLLILRRGGKSSLIVYAGTFHVVVPATTDEGIIASFGESLDPKIMPRDGDAAAEAFNLADRILADAGGGSILWIADGVAPEQAQSLAAWRKSSRTPVQLFPPLPEGTELQTLSGAARMASARLVRLAADDSDVRTLAHAAKSSGVAIAGSGERWKESGYWLVPLLALLTLTFFRRGWVLPTPSGR